MANPSNPASASSPVPPPVNQLAFVDERRNLTPVAFKFLQLLWAGVYGGGGIVDQLTIQFVTQALALADSETLSNEARMAALVETILGRLAAVDGDIADTRLAGLSPLGASSVSAHVPSEFAGPDAGRLAALAATDELAKRDLLATPLARLAALSAADLDLAKADLLALTRQLSSVEDQIALVRALVLGRTHGGVTSVGLTMPAEFSVAGSPITSDGTFTVTKATETANTVWAGPTTGAAAQPAFRALVNADMPSSGAGSGTVTSVSMTVPAQFAIGGTPITASGTLALTWANESANTVLAGPSSGGAATPGFRALVSADVPDLSSLYLPLTVTTVQTLTFNTTLPASGGLWTFATAQAADAGGTSNVNALQNNYQITGSANAGTHLANSTIARWSSSGTVTVMEGVRIDLRVDTGGTITTGNAVNAFVRATGASSVIGSARAVNISSPVVNTGGAITTATGVKIASQKPSGVTTGISLASDGASDYSYFAGTMSIGQTSAPAITLDVNGPIGPKSYTIGTLPTVGAKAGQIVYCSDLGGGGGIVESNGANWKRGGTEGYATQSTATGAKSLSVLTDAVYQNFTANLTGNVTVTLTTTNAYAGAKFTIRNSGVGAFTFAIANGGGGGGTLVTFAVSTAKSATCVYDGTDWKLMQDSAI